LKNMNFKNIVLILFLADNLQVFSQSVLKADLQQVAKSGYYNIELSQSLTGLAYGNNFAGIRIVNSEQKEVPYFLRASNPVQEINHFENYSFTQSSIKDSINNLIINNIKGDDVSRFYVVVRNAEVEKQATVRGSADGKNWFIVKQRSAVWEMKSSVIDANNTMLLIDFPQGNYRYYEIKLSNSGKSPLKIVKVGTMQNANIYGQFTQIDLGKMTQKEENGNTTSIRFNNLNGQYIISKLEVTVNYKSDYYRVATISDSSHTERSFYLSSRTDNQFWLNDLVLNGSSIIRIENNDNPPLVIDSLRAYGLNRYLCAYLEANQRYTLLFSATEKQTPQYDIVHFQNDIPADLPIVKMLTIKQINQIPTVARQPLWIEKPLVLWGIIVLVGGVLLTICIRMIRQMSR